MPELGRLLEAIAARGGVLRVEGGRLLLLLPEEDPALEAWARGWGEVLALLALEAPKGELPPGLAAAVAEAVRRWGLPGGLLLLEKVRLGLGGGARPEA
ncbi:hypothetical protein TthHC11_06790 [Thermus thermophilus]|uniref:hypothetical protein n=1 Tax=Thermus thermophilus TaxID=274 RepID=UPI0011621A28|nr:hypothetical protein [Thermus thermophilus]BBL93145.1 hypothetical protein TthHC11_06790 [Thermus thermophilus]